MVTVLLLNLELNDFGLNVFKLKTDYILIQKYFNWTY